MAKWEAVLDQLIESFLKFDHVEIVPGVRYAAACQDEFRATAYIDDQNICIALYKWNKSAKVVNGQVVESESQLAKVVYNKNLGQCVSESGDLIGFIKAIKTRMDSLCWNHKLGFINLNLY